VSLSQTHIRPIVRGKARCNVEFGAKISISVTGEGFMFLDRLSFDPYNEGEDLKAQARTCRRRCGCYPKVICADQIYRTRAYRAFCLRHVIRLSGPRLGRPKSDPELLAEEKRQFPDDQRQRNAVEGKIGQGKRRCGLGLIREKLAVTQGSTIALNVLVMNLEKCDLGPKPTSPPGPTESQAQGRGRGHAGAGFVGTALVPWPSLLTVLT